MSPLPSVSGEWQALGGKGESKSLRDHDDPRQFRNVQGDACILVNPYFNRGTAFSSQLRSQFNLHGLLPRCCETIEQQAKRCLHQVRLCADDLSRCVYLLNLKNKNETLFYRVLVDNMYEMLPYVYTPTVGQACVRYSEIYGHPHGLYVSLQDRGNVPFLLANWRQNHLDCVELIVVSDGSRILGLGDLGINGMGIPVGKGALYVAAGGFHPSTVLPVIIDTGTNNEAFIKDEFYLGLRQKRAGHKEFYELMDEFLLSVRTRWPNCLVQFEDFSNDHCFDLLAAYRNRLLCFNDDIQGTGVVIASGFLNAIKIAKIENVEKMRIVFFGAGSAGVGVAEQISRTLQFRYNIPAKTCLEMFYMVDSKGLITSSRTDKLAEYKLPFVRTDQDSNARPLTDLLDIVKTVKPHALIGLSGQTGTFSEEILKTMGQLNQTPIIFPLSNPTKNSECTAESAYFATEGRVVFASGSPFAPVQIAGKSFKPSQGNNMYVFPGLGFGAWLAKSTTVSDNMLNAASITLADATSKEDLEHRRLYPDLEKVREVSAKIAGAVMEQAQKDGHSDIRLENYKSFQHFAADCMYFPEYTSSNL